MLKSKHQLSIMRTRQRRRISNFLKRAGKIPGRISIQTPTISDIKIEIGERTSRSASYQKNLPIKTAADIFMKFYFAG